MAEFCPRCGYYTDPLAIFCLGCGGNLAALRQKWPAGDPVKQYLTDSAATAARPLSAPGVESIGVAEAGGVASVADPGAGLGLDPGAGLGPDLGAGPGADPGAGLGLDPGAGLGPDLGAGPGADPGAGLGLDLGAGLGADFAGGLTVDPGSDLTGGAGLGSDMGVDFSGLDMGAAPSTQGPGLAADASSGELDFSALGGDSPAGAGAANVFDLDGGMGDGATAAFSASSDDGAAADPFAVGLDLGAADASAPSSSFDPSGVSGLDVTPATAPPAATDVFDLDAQFGSMPDGGVASGEIDFSALSSSGIEGTTGDVDFSNLSTLDSSGTSDSGGDMLDLSLSNFGGGMGELDFSSLVQDASGPTAGAGADAIDFSGLSSIDVAPPARPSSPGAILDKPSDDIVYDLDLDLGGATPAPSTGAEADFGGFNLDEKDVSAMEDDLLKASIISYKPSE